MVISMNIDLNKLNVNGEIIINEELKIDEELQIENLWRQNT